MVETVDQGNETLGSCVLLIDTNRYNLFRGQAGWEGKRDLFMDTKLTIKSEKKTNIKTRNGLL